uniref:Reticulon n=1 Tax=Myripristis murdjan TaxID=586833 RepID=A0A667WEB9_9TELE
SGFSLTQTLPISSSTEGAVVDLIYWRNVAKTGVVFTGLVVALASLFQLSAITVLSHLCLGVMCVTFPIRFYYKLLELLLSCKALKGQDSSPEGKRQHDYHLNS